MKRLSIRSSQLAPIRALAADLYRSAKDVMKTVMGVVLGLVIAASLAFAASDDVSNVSLMVGPTHLNDGDSIVIEQVVAKSPNLAVGDKVVVRGRYVLKSEENAQLCLFVTTKEPVSVPVIPTQQTEVKKGSGEFELSEVVRHPGFLHVSFYRIQDGKRFGSVYFGTEQQMKEWSYEIALDSGDPKDTAEPSGAANGASPRR